MKKVDPGEFLEMHRNRKATSKGLPKQEYRDITEVRSNVSNLRCFPKAVNNVHLLFPCKTDFNRLFRSSI